MKIVPTATAPKIEYAEILESIDLDEFFNALDILQTVQFEKLQDSSKIYFINQVLTSVVDAYAALEEMKTIYHKALALQGDK